MRRGFAMTAEAAFSLILISLAIASLPLFTLHRHDSEAFYLCSDASIVLAKSGAFSGGTLQQSVDDASALSGLCIRAESALAYAASCPAGKAEGAERISLEIPAWNGAIVEKARVSCSRPR